MKFHKVRLLGSKQGVQGLRVPAAGGFHIGQITSTVGAQARPQSVHTYKGLSAMRVMVLSDGETFTEVGGCLIAQVPDDLEPEELKNYLLDYPESVLFRFVE